MGEETAGSEGEMNEANLMRRLQVHATQLGARVLRNNVGMAWIGKPQHIRMTTNITLYAGDMVLRKAVPVKFGLGVGSSDLIGWRISDGKFVALEIKTESGDPTQEQLDFIAAIMKAGGIAGIIRSEEDLKKLLGQ
jgi:hypothetical protein